MTARQARLARSQQGWLLSPFFAFRRLVVRLLILLRLSSRVEVTHGEDSAVIGYDHAQRKRTLNDILRACPSLYGADATYTPPLFLASGHLTTIWAAMANFLTINRLEFERHYITVPDGGTIALDFTTRQFASERTPIVICIHGLSGGSHESYVRSVLEKATRPVSEGGKGWRGVVFTSRGCGNTPVTSKVLYHGGNSADVRRCVLYVQSLYPEAPLVAVGFSLGANILAKYLGEEGDSTPLRAGVVLSNPWDFYAGHIELSSSWLRLVYSRAMASNLRRIVAKHRHMFADADFPGLRMQALFSNPHQTLYEFDASFTRIIAGYDSAEHYYLTSSSNQYLPGIRRPLLGFNAFNDPITAYSCAPFDQAMRNPYFALATTKHGGHLGWFSFLQPRQRWIVTPTLEWLSGVLACEPLEAMPRIATRQEGGFTIEEKRKDVAFKPVGQHELVQTGDAKAAAAAEGLKGL